MYRASSEVILNDAKRKHQSLAVCCVNLANMPMDLVQSFYTGLAATVSSVTWATPFMPISVGVYQGDPLSNQCECLPG